MKYLKIISAIILGISSICEILDEMELVHSYFEVHHGILLYAIIHCFIGFKEIFDEMKSLKE
jgi:hypothetical protein